MKNIEEEIRKAIEEGKFDNLPGKGKPLNLSENPFEDPSWRTAHHLLKSNGFTLPWIEKRQEIEAELKAARAALQRTWAWRGLALKKGVRIHAIQSEWERAMQVFQERITELNKKIYSYNLEIPQDIFYRPRIWAEREVEEIMKGKLDFN